MNEMAYFALFGRISDKYVTEALIPVTIPIPAKGAGFKKSPLGRILTSPVFVAVVGSIAAVIVAVAVGLSLAGRSEDPSIQDPTSQSDTAESGHESSGGDATEPDTPAETETETQPEPDPDPFPERKNYGGSMYIMHANDMFSSDFNYLPEDLVFAGAGQLNADLFERVRQSEDYLGMKVGFMGNYLDHAEVLRMIGIMAQAGEDRNILVLSSGFTLASLATSNLLTPWDTLEGVNTRASYWDSALMDSHTQGGHSYIGYNSFIPPNAYAIAYSKPLYNASAAPRDLYSLVDSGGWTLEALTSVLTETASTAKYGLSVQDPLQRCALLTAAGFRVFDTVPTQDGGYTQSYTLPDNADAMRAIYARLVELTQCGRYEDMIQHGPAVPRIEGGELLMEVRLTRELASDAYGTDFGVLPLPKYDTAQTAYRSLHVNAYMGLFTDASTSDMVGETAEMLGYFSRHTGEIYNQAVMGVYGKDEAAVTAVHRDLHMLEIIHRSTHDLGLLNPDTSQTLTDPLGERSTELRSPLKQSYVRAMQKSLERYGW